MHISDIKAIVQSVESVPAGFGGLIMQRLWLSIAVGFAALVFGPQLLVGDEEVFALHLIGLGHRCTAAPAVDVSAQGTEAQTLTGV